MATQVNGERLEKLDDADTVSAATLHASSEVQQGTNMQASARLCGGNRLLPWLHCDCEYQHHHHHHHLFILSVQYSAVHSHTH